VNLTTNSTGNHRHSSAGNCASDDGGGSDTHFAIGDSNAGRGCPDDVSGVRNTNFAGSHSHTVIGSTGNNGSGGAFDNRPAYYTLAFIMRIL
jgi:hypothetical protein